MDRRKIAVVIGSVSFIWMAIAYAFAYVPALQMRDPRGKVKPRTIVTCDPELDDNNSLIRFLMFSDGYDVEGLIYASSQVHWKGDGKGGTQYIPGREYARAGRDLGPQTHWRWAEGERFIDENVEAYEKVYPYLTHHAKGFPKPAYLKSIIREGNVAFEGDMSSDTPGSDLIKEVLLDNDPRPVFIQVWGGPSTVARALKSIQDEYEGTPKWDKIKAKVSRKAKLCLSGLQDQTYTDYIRPNWPDIESLIKNAGVTPIGYGAKRNVADIADTLYYSAEWMSQNILGKGPLSDRYRVWGDGKQMSPGDFTDYFGMDGYTAEELTEMGYWVWTPPMPKGNFISEGDTPEFLNLIGNGLRAWEDPTWGGWGGRQKELSEQEKATGAVAAFGMRGSHDPVLPSFVADVQRNFAGRLLWCTTYDDKAVAHEPKIRGVLAKKGKPGQTLRLPTKIYDAMWSNVSCRQYKILGSYQGDVDIQYNIYDPLNHVTLDEIRVTIPEDAKPGDQIHIVTTVSDGMTSYLRTVITVK